MTAHDAISLTIGLVAWATNLGGNVLVMLKRSSGWAVRIISILLWGAYGITDTSLPNLLNSISFLIFNVYAWRRWRIEEIHKRAEEQRIKREIAQGQRGCDECGGPVLMLAGSDEMQCKCTRWQIVAIVTDDDGPEAA